MDGMGCRTGPGMRQVVGFGGIGTREGGNFGANTGCPIVPSGEFAAYLCQIA